MCVSEDSPPVGGYRLPLWSLLWQLREEGDRESQGGHLDTQTGTDELLSTCVCRESREEVWVGIRREKPVRFGRRQLWSDGYAEERPGGDVSSVLSSTVPGGSILDGACGRVSR